MARSFAYIHPHQPDPYPSPARQRGQGRAVGLATPGRQPPGPRGARAFAPSRTGARPWHVPCNTSIAGQDRRSCPPPEVKRPVPLTGIFSRDLLHGGAAPAGFPLLPSPTPHPHFRGECQRGDKDEGRRLHKLHAEQRAPWAARTVTDRLGRLRREPKSLWPNGQRKTPRRTGTGFEFGPLRRCRMFSQATCSSFITVCTISGAVRLHICSISAGVLALLGIRRTYICSSVNASPLAVSASATAEPSPPP